MRHLYEDDYGDELSMFTINTCNEWLYTYNPDQDMDYLQKEQEDQKITLKITKVM